MSVHGVADKTVEMIESGKYPFIVLNFANPDMVGHTGVYDAAVEAVGHCDQAIGTVYEACKKHGYILMVTADHGNAEKMLSDDGKSPHTAHTVLPQPKPPIAFFHPNIASPPFANCLLSVDRPCALRHHPNRKRKTRIQNQWKRPSGCPRRCRSYNS